MVLLRRSGHEWEGEGVRRAVKSEQGTVGCFATPDLRRSRPTMRGQSEPHHFREREREEDS